jgi:hypothetical protein
VLFFSTFEEASGRFNCGFSGGFLLSTPDIFGKDAA